MSAYCIIQHNDVTTNNTNGPMGTVLAVLAFIGSMVEPLRFDLDFLKGGLHVRLTFRRLFYVAISIIDYIKGTTSVSSLFACADPWSSYICTMKLFNFNYFN